MRSLIISDEVLPQLYGPSLKRFVGDVDLIISCGDLPFYYIEFIISTLNKPAYYVFGNHGREMQVHMGKDDAWQTQDAPMGAINLHCRTAKVNNLLLAGLEGSIRYNLNSERQYTDREMWANIWRLAPKLLVNRIRFGRYLDVLVTHSPPKGIHDQPDRAHTGFTSFLTFMRWFKPRYLLHGHIHLYRGNETTQTRYHATDVINIYPYKILDLSSPLPSST